MTTQEFLRELKDSGHWNDIHDYSKFIFSNRQEKGIIVDDFGLEHKIAPCNLLKGSRLCIKNAIDKTAYFICCAKKIHYDENYDYSLCVWVDSKTPVIIIDEFGFKHEIIPNNLLNREKLSALSVIDENGYFKYRAGKISKKGKLNKDEFDYSKVDIKADVLKKATTKVTIIHKGGCGREFPQTPNKHLAGQGCPFCVGKQKDTRKFIEEAEGVHGKGRYDYSKFIYSGAKEKGTHNMYCVNGEFPQSPTVHIHSKCGCPDCQESKGEKEIAKHLMKFGLKKGIDFFREHKFDDCRCIKRLPFDYFLPAYNTCIEFDGPQHEKSVDWFGGEDGYKKRMERDKIKDAYCERNRIGLLRIRDDEFHKIENLISLNVFVAKLLPEIVERHLNELFPLSTTSSQLKLF